jgi:hypothetical protein
MWPRQHHDSASLLLHHELVFFFEPTSLKTAARQLQHVVIGSYRRPSFEGCPRMDNHFQIFYQILIIIFLYHMNLTYKDSFPKLFVSIISLFFLIQDLNLLLMIKPNAIGSHIIQSKFIIKITK